jgi:hypothetical protein
MAEGQVLNIMNGAQERVTGGYASITTDHANIHNHEGYSANIDSTTLGASSWLRIQFNTGSNAYVHFKLYEGSATNTLARVSILEATTASTFIPSTSAITYYNKSRVNSSDYASDSELFLNPTQVDRNSNFNILESILIGSSGTQLNPIGSGQRSLDLEWVFKQNSTYIIELLNIGPNAGQCSLFAFWYEEGDA